MTVMDTDLVGFQAQRLAVYAGDSSAVSGRLCYIIGAELALLNAGRAGHVLHRV